MSSSCTAHDSRADASASAPPRLSSAAPVAMIASYVSSMRKSSWLSGLGFLSCGGRGAGRGFLPVGEKTDVGWERGTGILIRGQRRSRPGGLDLARRAG
eukprot:224786-Chlamydomonas_euryale.AAC.1